MERSRCAGVITASEPYWMASFAGPSPRQSGKPVMTMRGHGEDTVSTSRP